MKHTTEFKRKGGKSVFIDAYVTLGSYPDSKPRYSIEVRVRRPYQKKFEKVDPESPHFCKNISWSMYRGYTDELKAEIKRAAQLEFVTEEEIKTALLALWEKLNPIR